MYRISDYIRNGLLYANNMTLRGNKKLSQLMIYATTQCQSRCKHCSIWKKDVEYLTLDDIKAIVGSRCVLPSTTVGLEGGEFILHPQADEIMNWFQHNHPNYTLLTNALKPAKVIEAVRKYKPRHLYISLDGNKETYKVMRGCDGHDRVLEVARALKGELPISFMFCLSPWNTFEDMRYVIDVAKELDVDVRIGIYGQMEFFDTTAEMLEAKTENYFAQIPANIHDTSENFDFVALYDEWRKGALKLRCQSIYSSLVIHPNGNVPVCQNKEVVLGNIHENTLDEIFNRRSSRKIQCDMSHNCNDCWINFHRKYDIILVRNMEHLLPKRVIEWFYGKYQWTRDSKMTYRRYFKSLNSKL